jgi:hypothetical protein
MSTIITNHKLLSACVLLVLVLAGVSYWARVAVESDTGGDSEELRKKQDTYYWSSNIGMFVGVITLGVIAYELYKKRQAKA